jgi:VWFA-related protein
VILIADRGFYGGFGYTGDADMERLARDTGGRVINVGNNGKKLQEAFDQIQDELRTQYLASYTSTNPKVNDGTFRTLNITCQQGQKIQARKGYYAMADMQGKDD